MEYFPLTVEELSVLFGAIRERDNSILRSENERLKDLLAAARAHLQEPVSMYANEKTLKYLLDNK